MDTRISSNLKHALNAFVASKFFHFGWIFLLIALCFGILIPKLGFYWDDLPYLYQYAAFGPDGFSEFVASDRPFSAWIFSLTTFLFGFNPIGYHLLALFLRWICAILFFEIIQHIWEKNRGINLVVSSIFAIYPGFLQQPIALIYNHHLSVFALLLLSIYLMILNISREKRSLFLAIISILLAFGLFSIENFSTLELIRPFILWKILKEKKPSLKSKDLAMQIFMIWIPYLLIFTFFVIWRVVILKFPTYSPTIFSSIMEDPRNTIHYLFSRIPKDFFTVSIGAWIQSFYFPSISDFGVAATYLFWGLVLFTFLVSMSMFNYWLNRQSNFENPKHTKKIILEMLASCFLLYILPASIVWTLDLPLKIEFAWDRMTIAFLPAIALLVGGLIIALNKIQIIQTLFLSLLISFSVGSHFENAMSYKRDWEILDNFIWQLSWRVPSLEENTMLIASDVGLDYYSDNSLTSPVNLMYSDDKITNQLSHLVYFTDARDDNWFEENNNNLEIYKPYRSFWFRGNSNDIIAFHFKPPGCLKILDRKYSNSITNPNLSFRQVDEIPFSKLDLIHKQPIHTPFNQLFSKQSTKPWCYYFEKADLARQFADYEEIARLGDIVLNINQFPRVASEWLPFLEGYLWEEKWEKSRQIIEYIRSSEGNYSDGLCYTLQRIDSNPNYPHHSELTEIILSYNCS